MAAGTDVGGLAGVGITATVPGATVDNNGQIVSTGLLDSLGIPTLGTADAVDLNAGGTVNNGPNAVIDGTVNGITVAGGVGTINNNSATSQITGATDGIAAATNTTVDNVGSILGTAGSGIAMTAGGTVANTAGTVTGALDGISITGTPAGSSSGVTNSGAISATGPAGVGVALDAGNLVNSPGGTVAAASAGGIGVTLGTGSLSNGAGATISGALDGVEGTATSALTNAGTITGGTGAGIAATAGTVTNDAGGVISGALDGVSMATPGTVDNLGTITATAPGGIGVDLLDGGVVIDAGTISGSDAAGNPGGTAVNLGGTGGSRLVLDPGAVLNGAATASGSGNTLEIAAGAGPVTLADIGTSVTGFGTTTIDAGASLDVLGGVTAPGTISVGNGASLTVGGPVATGVDVDLGAGNATLKLDDPTGFAGTIANLVPGDTLDLSGLGVGTTVSYTPGTGLTITPTTGTSSVIPVTLPAGVSLGLTPDGLGVTVSTGGTGTTVTTGGGTGTGGTGTGGTGAGGTGTGTGTDTGSGNGATISGGGSTSTSGATTTTTTDPNGGTTVVSTDPLGATSTLDLPAGSSIAYGTGAAQGDVVSIDPSAAFNRAGRFTITGHVSSLSGVSSVAISASIDGGDQVTLGTADVAADGSFTFQDRVGPHLQAFITATETDGAGATTSVQSPYSLEAGYSGVGFKAQQVLYNPDGSQVIGTTNYHRDGSSTVNVGADEQTFQSDFFTTFHNGSAPDNTFVFSQGHGLSVVDGFRANGTDHDTISLPSADFSNFADVLRDTQNTAGGAVITDPVAGDTIRIAGVNKAELRANPGDFKFHA